MPVAGRRVAARVAERLGGFSKPLATFSTVAALLFAGLSFRVAATQAHLARQQALADRIADIGKAAASCHQGVADSSAALSPADVWEMLCTSRALAYEVLVQDLIVAAADPRFLNAGPPSEISIHLEDAMVRELVQVTRSLENRRPAATQEDRCRSRALITATYMLAHSGGTSAGDLALAESFGAEIAAHRRELALRVDIDHDRRFLELTEMLERLAPAEGCRVSRVGSTLFGPS